MEFFDLLVLLSALICHFASWDLQKKQAKQVKLKLQKISNKEDLSFIREISTDSSRLPLSASISTIAIWLEILSVSMLASVHILASIGAVLFIAIRFRVLQETTHFLVHTNRLYAWLISDLFFHFPTGKKRAAVRRELHMNHHSGTVSVHDPNLTFTVPLLKKLLGVRFARTSLLLYPLTPRQIFLRAKSLIAPIYADRVSATKSSLLRALGLLAFLAITYSFVGSWRAWLLLIVLPIFALFPLFSWWGELCEHRWLAQPEKGIPKLDREIFLGNVMVGRVVPELLLPWGDRFHVIHTINPRLCPRSMRIIHQDLLRNSIIYSNQAVASLGIFRLTEQAVLTRLVSDAGKFRDESVDNLAPPNTS